MGDFYALDCEFTGLESNGGGGDKRKFSPPLPPFRPPSCELAQPATATDDPEERWPALASQASRFAVAQVGIAVFEWVKGGSGSNGGNGRGCYRAHAFNCWTFVSPDASSSASFQCTPGSLSFLSSAGFDFNR